MLELTFSYEDFKQEEIPKILKSPLLLKKENNNRTFQKTKHCRNLATPHSLNNKKRMVSQKGHSITELKFAKKKRKKGSVFALKYPHPPPIQKEIEEIGKSINRLTQELEDNRRNENGDDSTASLQNFRYRQILPEFGTNHKSKNNLKDFSKQKLGMKNKYVTDITSSHIHKYNGDQERSRIKNSLEPIKALTADTIVGMLSLSHNKAFQNGIGPKKLKNMHERLARVREFIKNINTIEMRSSICSDGMNHKDNPQKKNNNAPNPSEAADNKGNEHYRNIQQIVKTRRILNRNRVFASRPPLLETVIEEPEKEEEEAKLYDTL